MYPNTGSFQAHVAFFANLHGWPKTETLWGDVFKKWGDIQEIELRSDAPHWNRSSLLPMPSDDMYIFHNKEPIHFNEAHDVPSTRFSNKLNSIQGYNKHTNSILSLVLWYRWGDWVGGRLLSPLSAAQLGSGRPEVQVQVDRVQALFSASSSKGAHSLGDADGGRLLFCVVPTPGSCVYLFLWHLPR